MELVSGDRTGRQDWPQANGQHVHQSASHHFIKSSCNGLTPTLCPAPGVAPPSPGSESLHPLPLGGLGMRVDGMGLAGMCGAGGRVWGQVPLRVPTGGLLRGLTLKPA